MFFNFRRLICIHDIVVRDAFASNSQQRKKQTCQIRNEITLTDQICRCIHAVRNQDIDVPRSLPALFPPNSMLSLLPQPVICESSRKASWLCTTELCPISALPCLAKTMGTFQQDKWEPLMSSLAQLLFCTLLLSLLPPLSALSNFWPLWWSVSACLSHPHCWLPLVPC